MEMIDISVWMNSFLQALDKAFGERVWFVGLQGSYARAEATENSDIDLVVILDEATVADIAVYNSLLDSMTHRELICGFFSGRNELMNWEPSDLFQFYYDTVPIRGSLDQLLPLLDRSAVSRAIKIGLCNIYHACVHNMLHEKSSDALKALYKSACFVVQAICYAQNGNYIRRLNDLLQFAAKDEQEILATFLHLKNGESVDFQSKSELLFNWCRKRL